jgi:hypothetical protein
MNSMFFRYVVCVFVFMGSVFVGCSPDRVPGNVIGKEELASIIVDIHVAEALYFQQRSNYRKIAPEALTYYKSILDKHGVSKELLDTTILWYSNHPKVYLVVYDKVVATLSEKQAFIEGELTKQMAEEKEKKNAEIKNLWKGLTNYHLPSKDTLDPNLPFKFTLDSLQKGQLSLSVAYLFKKEDISSKNELYLITCYADSTRDTTIVEISKSFTKKKTFITASLKDSSKVFAVEGYLLKHQSAIRPYVDIDEILLQYLPAIVPVVDDK